jgi:hypothetical protein
MALARPTPYSWNVGDTITQTLLNGIRDALNWGQQPPDLVAYQNTAQSIPNTSWTPVALDTNILDSYSGHSTTTNNSRYVCQTGAAGWYTVCGIVAYSPNSTGFRTARLQVNGSPILGGAGYLANDGSVEVGIVTPTRDLYLNVGDYVEVAAYQSSGGALNTQLDVDLRSAFWVRFSHA